MVGTLTVRNEHFTSETVTKGRVKLRDLRDARGIRCVSGIHLFSSRGSKMEEGELEAADGCCRGSLTRWKCGCRHTRGIRVRIQAWIYNVGTD